MSKMASARAAREKALHEIRISLQPFAATTTTTAAAATTTAPVPDISISNNNNSGSNGRPHSSASSTTSDTSSSPGQTSGIGSSVSSNNDNKESAITLLKRERLLPDQPRILNSNGLPVNNDHGYHTTASSVVIAAHGLPNGHHNNNSHHHPHSHSHHHQQQQQLHNGVVIHQQQQTASAAVNNVLNSAAVNQSPHHQHFHHHSPVNRSPSLSSSNGVGSGGVGVGYIANEPPPPLPPPRGTTLAAASMPLQPPSSVLSGCSLTAAAASSVQIPVQKTTSQTISNIIHNNNINGSVVNCNVNGGTAVPPHPQLQHLIKRMSSSNSASNSSINTTIVHHHHHHTTTNGIGISNGLVGSVGGSVSGSSSSIHLTNSRTQAYSYASSASSSSPQRGTSPISFINGHSSTNGSSVAAAAAAVVAAARNSGGGGVNCATNLAHLTQQLQSLGLTTSSTVGLTPQQLHSSQYPQSPVSFNSIYSAPPSYAASSSSGRQSPTPTISSSSDYASVPPREPVGLNGLNGLNLNMQQLHKKLSPVSSTTSISSLTHTSHTSASSSTSSLVTRPALQAWTARQAISQSPVIMQSVKSTHVHKPVLQTAVAPTISPIISSAPKSMRSESSIVPPPVPPPSYLNSSAVPLPGSVTNNHLNLTPEQQQQLATAGHHSPYINCSVQKSSSTTTSSSRTQQIHTDTDCYPANPPPSYATAMQQQQQKLLLLNTNNSATAAVIADQSAAGTVVIHQQQSPLPLSHPPPPPPPPPYKDVAATKQQQQQSDTQYVTVSVSPFTSEFVNGANQMHIPTTEPPSYASSVAALAAQRAVINSTQQLSSSSYNTRTTPTIQMPTRPPPMPPNSDRSDLVNTVESICNSQVSALPSGARLRQLEACPPLPPKPNQLTTTSDVTSIASSNNTDFDSDTASVSTTSTCDKKSASQQHKTTHQSPIPPRKSLSYEKEKERRESKVKIYSPAAFKFFMEQHIENVIKCHLQRETRRLQLEQEMAKAGLSDEDQNQMRQMLYQKESNYLRLKRAKMDRSLFTKIKNIGVGAFGEVALVRKNDANQLYAMKTLRKSDVLKRNQVAHVKAERDILAEADNEWVVKLYFSFQDEDCLYFVMEYIPGGDLMSLLIKFGIFEEPLARFYISELVAAVESVHKMGFIHRDIKPDNILIDRDGHIKLTDFGLCTGFRWTHDSKYYQRNDHDRQDSMDIDESWSVANNCHCHVPTSVKPLERRKRREHQRCLAHSLVGTPNYIAPEVLMRTGYTQLCDWWSVGVILYEMIVGIPPFNANTPEETQNKVIHWDKTLRIPKDRNFSPASTDLIVKLCCGPEDRLGRNGADEIKRHSFFDGIVFDGDLRKQPAPYIPEIKHETDTSNFDEIDDKLYSNGMTNGGGGGGGCLSRDDYNYINQMNGNNNSYDNSKHPEHAFFEFTFRRFFDAGGQAYPIKLRDSNNMVNNNSNNNNGGSASAGTAATVATDNGQGSPVYV
ncbi:LOW QUALITY PROTEIN: serine/threonine-protein kinase Warts-like [Oppia nitens]|uniref:LOW QUALITY PROTEIN: serine/threonine-protein kinase Warts-like n=1 Tax=Oppia nitens TaxID=1686743 RepID=UPI0023DB9B39|nr:LOW QUALITY PROTEIN: serine/threonine-protein kinase Warts-like [Oppia nitens]